VGALGVLRLHLGEVPLHLLHLVVTDLVEALLAEHRHQVLLEDGLFRSNARGAFSLFAFA
jgi:hypothetical protein